MWRLAPFLWYGFIFASSCKSVNGEDIERQIDRRFKGKQHDQVSALWKRFWWLPVKGWHATEFAILYALFRKAGWDKATSLSMVAFAASLDEYHQTFVEGRTGTARDVLIDMGGAATAAGLESLIQPRLKGR